MGNAGDHDEDEIGQGWFLVWPAASVEKPLLIQFDLDVHNWDHLVLNVEGPFSYWGARLWARLRYGEWPL